MVYFSSENSSVIYISVKKLSISSSVNSRWFNSIKFTIFRRGSITIWFQVDFKHFKHFKRTTLFERNFRFQIIKAAVSYYTVMKTKWYCWYGI